MADRDSVLEIRNGIIRGEIYNSYFPLHLRDFLKQKRLTHYGSLDSF